MNRLGRYAASTLVSLALRKRKNQRGNGRISKTSLLSSCVGKGSKFVHELVHFEPHRFPSVDRARALCFRIINRSNAASKQLCRIRKDAAAAATKTEKTQVQ